MKFFLKIILLGFVISCTNKISQDKFVDLLIDFEKVQISSFYLGNNTLIPSHEYPSQIDSILKKHNIEKTLFLASLEYLLSNPIELKSLYEKAIEKTLLQKENLNPKKDSLP